MQWHAFPFSFLRFLKKAAEFAKAICVLQAPKKKNGMRGGTLAPQNLLLGRFLRTCKLDMDFSNRYIFEALWRFGIIINVEQGKHEDFMVCERVDRNDRPGIQKIN